MSTATARGVAAAPPVFKSPGGDIQSSGSGYGAAQANAFKQSLAYKQAVVETFLHQSTQQQAAILRGARQTPTPEGKLILSFYSSPISRAQQVADQHIPSGGSMPLGVVAPGAGTVGSIAHDITQFGGKVAGNTLSDAVNFVPGTVQGLYGMASQVLQGNPGKAASMFIDPFVNAIEHPVSSFVAHPLNTAMMVGGPETMVGRAAGSVARSGILGDAAKAAADTTRAPLRLGGDIAGAPNPLVEARSYSPNMITKAMQVANEQRLRARGIDPNIARRTRLPSPLANALNVGLEAKTRQLGDRAVAFERMAKGKEDRTIATSTIRAARPHGSVQNVVSHILQGIVRTPQTAVEDLMKEINRLKAADTGARTAANFANRAQVRDLTAALHSPHLGEAFTSANTIRDFLHAQDAYAVEKGLLPPEMAQRSRVLKYAMAHMGATYDHTRGEFVVPGSRVTKSGVRYGRVRPLGTQEILDHIAGKRTVTTPNPDFAKAASREAKAAAMIRDAKARGEKAPGTQPTPVGPYGTEGELAASQAALRRLAERRGSTPKERVSTVNSGLKVPDPAYVGHYPGKQASFRFYKRWQAARGSLRGHKLEGTAFKSGNYDHTYDALVAQSARTQEALTHAGFHDYLVNNFGIGKPKSMQTGKNENGLYTPNEGRALAFASQYHDDGMPRANANPLVPMTAFGAKTPLAAVEHLQTPADLQHVDGLEHEAIARAVADAARKEDGVRNIVLMPHSLLDQVSRNVKPAGDVGRTFGRVTSQFKRTVLPYSTHWMGQIATEAALRGLVAGVVDPRNIVAGHQIMNELKARGEAGRSVARETTNATFYNRNDPLAKFNPNPSPIATAIKGTPIIGDRTIPLPGGHAIPGLIGAHTIYADRVGAVMGGLEHQFRLMGLGKVGRQQLQEFTKSYQAGIRLQAQNVSLLVDKLTTDRALVTKLGRQIEDIFGKYNALSPKVRAATQTVVPFLPWYLNAARFVLWTLPVKHPLASSLAAALRQTIANDVANGKAQPLTPYQEQALAKFTPGGIFPQPGPNAGGPLGELAATAMGTILPQVSSAGYEMIGRNAFGDAALKGPGGDVAPYSPQAIASSAEALAEAGLPGLSKLRTIFEGGGTPYGTSTLLSPQTKPGTGGGIGAIINRLFNPLRAFQSASAAAASGAGGGGTSFPNVTPAGNGNISFPNSSPVGNGNISFPGSSFDFSGAGSGAGSGGSFDFSQAGSGGG